MSYSEIKQAFRNISENTWNNINNAQRLNLKLGEVTITELIILYLEILGSTKTGQSHYKNFPNSNFSRKAVF